MILQRLDQLWNTVVIRALIYVALILMCYLFGEFSVPFIYRDF
jgi:hypothetical protein